ncbi:major facilitator superfamily domain-containing protein [Lentinula aciculospora]|uniref:Major facilitator superfamily domain-containing protein n=1 Tax=Lentinula aciculospora TaxID=153920 RepID=A0A9W8ZY50_9AGAR|nr:major facilitator superfamily domain-containing protein [Lentinula aciculospora]
MSTISEKQYTDSSPIVEVDDKSLSSGSLVHYSVFSLRQRITIILVVSSVSILSSLSSALYTPALPKMAGTLGVSISAVNFTITTYLLLQGLSPLFSGAIGDSLGRRMLYSVTLTIYIGACIGLSITDAYPVVLVLCGILAAGAAPNTALGAGVIGDLVPASQRGGFMGLYNAGIGLGDAVGPVLGGAFAQFTGYHGIFIFLLAISATLLALIITILPETLHSIVGNGSILPTWYLRPLLPWLLPSQATAVGDPNSLLPARRLDIFGPIRLLKQPDVLCCLAFTGICYMVWQMSMVATSAQYSSQYHLNEFSIGLTYISNGIGELVGSLLMGRILDHEYRRQLRCEAAGETTSAKDVISIGRARLNSLRLPIPMFIGSIVAFGWVVQVHTHIAIPVVFAFLIGWSVQSILTALATLLVDLFEDQSSTATATFIMIKGFMGAVGSSSIQPMINALGTGWTFTILGGVCTLALPTILAEFYFGGGWHQRRVRMVQQNEQHDEHVLEYQPPITKTSTEVSHSSSVSPAVFPADFSPQMERFCYHYEMVNDTVANKKIVSALSREFRFAPLSVVLLSALYITMYRITGQEGGALGYRISGECQPRIVNIILDSTISA